MKRFTILFASSLLLGVNFALASQSSGTIDATYHYAKVCHDSTCSSSGTINFLPTGTTPITIDDTNGIDGTAWGSELGWITFGRVGTTSVTISPTSGALSGYAWSQVSGWINMAPTGYGVSINSNGEFTGYAWSGGPMGGWIKFDCASGSGYCVKTDWRPTGARTSTVPSGGGGGGGGGGGSVILPTATQTPTKTTDDSRYKTQAGAQNQPTDYTSEFRADINDSGLVDIFDYNSVMVQWGKTSNVDMTKAKVDRCALTLSADVNCDGGVDALDFNLVMVYWGQYVGQQGIELKSKTLKQINTLLQLR